MTKAGNKALVERLVEEDLPRTLRFALRLTGCHDEAEEVVQEALCRAARAVDSFRGESQFRTWFYRIVISAFHDRLAAAARERSSGELADEVAYVYNDRGKGVWFKTEEEHAYKAPGLYRTKATTVGFEDTQPFIRITDEIKKIQLTLWPVNRTAEFAEMATQGHDPRGAFMVASDEIKKGICNGSEHGRLRRAKPTSFRSANDSHGRHWSVDFWIDSVTKQLLREQIPRHGHLRSRKRSGP